ncbi:MAG: T9SS type A sorting domain-containing protein [Bacteroidales bacterium]|nr:T9SS type A sorting domain-containing protein [Bacteroidales bacterium]
MKKLYLILLLAIFFGLKAIANPLPFPTIEISELFFEAQDEWVLELAYFYYDDPEIPIIDSIFLCSSTDSVKLPEFEFEDESGIIILRNDSLDSEFEINRSGDTLRLIFYVFNDSFEDVLIFGNCDGAVISYPREEQSISRYLGYFDKDKSPSIGEFNDSTGICGTVTGYIYDKYSEPVSNVEFSLDYRFTTSEDGRYSTRGFSKPSEFHHIYHYITPYSTEYVDIENISYIMEPDSVITLDMQLIDTLATGFNPALINNHPVKIYPNPLTHSENLYYEIDLPVRSSKLQLEVLNIDGKILLAKKITSATGVIELPDIRGIVLVAVRMDNQLIAVNRIIIKND